MFHTYISPEVYELFVKEVSAHFSVDINRFKTGYDCASCLLDVAMSFLAFGPWHFVGVKWGTILCALINGWIIGQFSTFYEKHWTFYDRFPLRKYFVPDAAQPSAQRQSAFPLTELIRHSRCVIYISAFVFMD